MRIVLAIAALAVAGAAAATWADHTTCQDARRVLFLATFRPTSGEARTQALEDVRATCRGTSGLLAAAGALRAQGERDAALRLAREAAEAEPENPAAWRAVAATASGDEARGARARLGELDPRSR